MTRRLSARRRLLPLMMLTLLFGVPASRAAESALNFIVFFVDDLGWADPAVYGSDWHATPHFDALAARGVRFTNAYAASPVCSPTRAALLTGRSPARLMLTQWLPGPGQSDRFPLRAPAHAKFLPLEETTLAEMLRDAGWATAHIGKWHLGGGGYGPTKQGFGVNVGGDHRGTPASYFSPYAAGGDAVPGLVDGDPGEYLTDRLTREAVAFIEDHSDQPFFLHLAHSAMHVPLVAPADVLERWQAKANPDGQHRNPVYAAMLESVDTSLGELMSAVARIGATARTVFIVTSDNGGLVTRAGPNTPATSNAPLRAGKGFLYEGGLRVPLLIDWPSSARQGDVEDEPVVTMDLFATIAELAGLNVKARIDGVSLVPLLAAVENRSERSLYWHYPHYSDQGGAPGGVVRSGPLKLIEFFGSDQFELYDVVADPGETINLAEDRPADVSRLRRELGRWREAIGAELPTANPDFPPSLWSRLRRWLGV